MKGGTAGACGPSLACGPSVASAYESREGPRPSRGERLSPDLALHALAPAPDIKGISVAGFDCAARTVKRASSPCRTESSLPTHSYPHQLTLALAQSITFSAGTCVPSK